MKKQHHITLNIPIHLSNKDYSILSQAMQEYTALVFQAYQLALGYRNRKRLQEKLTRTEIYSMLKTKLKILNTRYLLAAISDALKAKKSKLEKKKRLKFLILERLKLKPQLRVIGRKDRGCASSIRIDFEKYTLIIRLKNNVIKAKMKSRNYHKRWLNYLRTRVEKKETSYTVRVIKIKNKPITQITFPIFPNVSNKTTRDLIIGVDFNPTLLAIAIIDKSGNLKKFDTIRFDNDLSNNMSRGERIRILGRAVKKLIKVACKLNASIVIEDLKLFPQIFKDKRKRQIPFSKFKRILISNSAMYGYELVLVNPAHTSNIARFKYFGKIKRGHHHLAAFLIARRGAGIMEKIPTSFLRYKIIKKMIPSSWELKNNKINPTRITWHGPYIRFVPRNASK